MSICEEIRARLFELQDIKYRDFHAKLVPNIDPEKIIGVRTPVLRKLAAELANRAAGVVVGKIGTAPILFDELLAAIKE